MGQIALSEIRTRARQRSNQENSPLVTSSEQLSYINASAQWLYDQLVEAYGQNYNLKSTSFTLTSGTNPYTLPSDFYQLVAVDRGPAGGRVMVRPYQIHERNRTFGELRYFFDGQTLRFSPETYSSDLITLTYVPLFTPLVLDADTLNGLNGWEEFVVLDTARKMLSKEESDTTQVEGDMKAIYERIERLKHMRDQSFTNTVQDSRRVFGYLSRDEEIFYV